MLTPFRHDSYLIIICCFGSVKKDREQRAGGEEERIATQYSVNEEMNHSVRILLAEDNPMNQKLAKLMLTKGGYHNNSLRRDSLMIFAANFFSST